MQRITSSDSQFHDGNPSTGVLGTFLAAAWHNAVQEELAGFIEGAGIALDPTSNGQLVKALYARLVGSVPLADSGAINAYAAANVVPLTAQTLVHGVRQRVTIATTNNGPSTYAPDGLPAKPIIGLDLQGLQGLELIATQIADMEYIVAASVNGGSGAWLLHSCGGGAMQIPVAVRSLQAVQLGQLASGAVNLGNRAVFLANASFVVPQNVTTMWVTGTAAGGGGGGSGGVSGVTSGYSATSGAGGGGAGQFVIKQQISVTPGQTLTIVVGAPGTAGPAGAAGGYGGNGGAGGNNTITGTGVNVTLSGGPGGAPSGLASGNNGVSTPGNAGNSSAGDGMYGLAVPGYGYDYGGDGGCGGSTPFGIGGGVANQANAAHLPTGYGAGGSGASGVVTSSSAPGRAGAAGSQGFWMLEW